MVKLVQSVSTWKHSTLGSLLETISLPHDFLGYDPLRSVIVLISPWSLNDIHYHNNEWCSPNGSPSCIAELERPSGFAALDSLMSKDV